MSMICSLLGLSPIQIGALRTTPSLAADLTLVAGDSQLSSILTEAMNRLPLEQMIPGVLEGFFCGQWVFL